MVWEAGTNFALVSPPIFTIFSGASILAKLFLKNHKISLLVQSCRLNLNVWVSNNNDDSWFIAEDKAIPLPKISKIPNIPKIPPKTRVTEFFLSLLVNFG